MVHHIPDSEADRSGYPGQDKPHPHPISDEYKAREGLPNRPTSGTQGVEATADDDKGRTDATAAQDAATTIEIGRARMTESGTGGQG